MADEKKSRRKKGSGTLVKLPSGAFRAELKYKDKNGESRVLRSTHNTKSEAERTLARYQREVKNIKAASTSEINKITVAKYFDDIYLPYKKRTAHADSTYKRYASTVYTHIISEHGRKILRQVTSDDVLDLLEKKKESGLGYSSVKKIHDAYGEMFKYAIARNDIVETENPMRLAPMISRKRFDEDTTPRFFTYDEIRAFTSAALFQYSNGSMVYRYGPVFMFMLNTGLRVGEVCALTKEEVDLEKNLVRVNHGVSDRLISTDGLDVYQKVISSPKRPNSVRIVPLNQEAVKYAQMIFQTHTESEQMFICNNKGSMVQPGTLNKQMNSILSRAGIENGGSPHTLRHTFVTVLFDKGIDIHVIANLIGDDVITVKKTYLHILQERKAQAIELTNITN